MARHAPIPSGGASAPNVPRSLTALGAVALAYWTAIELWGLGLNALNGLHPPRALLPGQVLSVCGAALASVAACSLVRRWPAGSAAGRFALGANLALAASSAYALFMIALGRVVPVARPPGAYGLAHFAWETLFFLIPFALWIAFVLVMEDVRHARERDTRLAEALITSREAELRALHYQVNPHFLFNALNSLSTLIIDGRAREADDMVHRLAAFLRGNLALDPLVDIRLEDEIATQELYLSIEEIRYRDRLAVVIDVPLSLRDALVPSLILQPLVENAVKHGVHEPGRTTRIEVQAEAHEGYLTLVVRDNGPGASTAAGTGLGLDNVRRRLRARFGDAAALHSGPAEDGYTAAMRLPLDLAKRSPHGGL